MVRPGDRVSDRYQVIEHLATGGMGTLWRARHLELGVDVALKVISSGSASPRSLKRFKHEAQAAARLRSPNIVQVLDFGVFEGQPYLAMELLQGEDLAKRLARQGRLPMQCCLHIVEGVAKAVQLAHDAEIVHRDLKPANIFLEQVADDLIVKVLDFGVAKDLRCKPDPDGTTGEGAIGSPAYMSPEQVWAEKIGPSADVWALSVVTFEMLAGENPFVDDTLAKVFERILRAPVPKLSEINAALPASLDAFFERALNRNPGERISTARAFAEQFRQAIDDPDGAAVGPNSPRRPLAATGVATTLRRRGGPAARQRRWVGWLSAAFVLAGVLALLLAIRPSPQPTNGARASSPLPDPATKSAGSESALAPPPSLSGTGLAPGTSAQTGARAPLPVASQAVRSNVVPASNRNRALGKPSPTPETPPSVSSATSPALDPQFGIPLP